MVKKRLHSLPSEERYYYILERAVYMLGSVCCRSSRMDFGKIDRIE